MAQAGGTMTFEEKRVRLRALERSDLSACVKWIGDSEVREFLMFRYPMSMAEEERWFDNYLKSSTDRIFAIETKDGKYIGNVGLHRIDLYDRHAELGVFIGDKAFWSKGCGTEAIMLMLDFAFAELNLHKVYLHHQAHNARARKCYEKCGFVEEGILKDHIFRNGKYIDAPVMGIINPRERKK
ncbi:MAG: GNAT family N-acetyltransferase [Euryarchaeota archaeon]|nr:GNAT family N-acetyltransferase [Euryarchaeota archaeon]